MRRIYKKRPFSAPNSVRVNELSNECEKLIESKNDVMKIRDMIVKGTMSKDLYAFLNMDGSLDNLFGGLPHKEEEASCECLTTAQLMVIDATVEDINGSLHAIKESLWDAFKEWFLDWWDVNRKARNYLREKAALFSSGSTSLFGDPRAFETIQMTTYIKSDWERMLISCKHLNDLLLKMPGTELPQWFNTHKPEIESCLSEFGQSVVLPGPRVIEGLPSYEVHNITLMNAGWRFAQMGAALNATVSIMSNEVESRRLFGLMERMFRAATENDVAAIKFARQLIMRSKANTYVVARALKRIIAAAEAKIRSKNTDQNK